MRSHGNAHAVILVKILTCHAANNHSGELYKAKMR